jgi:uncharacterized protein YbjT (DUF2867 family)
MCGVKVILFGATGMVGQGVLRECLLDDGVTAVLTVGRSATGQQHQKLREIVHPDLYDLAPVEEQLSGFDACFFCLGVTSAGMSEADYRRVTYDLTIGVAQILVRHNPDLTFVYVSGRGTGNRRLMWSRVKGDTENALLAMPFRAYMMRPGIIQPLHGITSRTRWYALFYAVLGVLIPVVRRVSPNAVTTTEQVGRAMIALALTAPANRILETSDINALAP